MDRIPPALMEMIKAEVMKQARGDLETMYRRGLEDAYAIAKKAAETLDYSQREGAIVVAEALHGYIAFQESRRAAGEDLE